jgi:hypothetical protein
MHTRRALLLTPVLLAVALLFCSPPASVRAQSLQSDAQALMVLQFALIWTGHYDGMVDGDIGPRSIAAIASFQRENGWSPNGVLSEEQIRRLLQRSEQNQRSVGFRLLEDARSRILIGLPTSLMVRSNDTEFGTRWVLRDDAEVIVGRFGPAQRTLQQLRERIIQSGKIKNYSMDVRPTRSTFFLAGEDDTRVYYFTGRMEGVDTVAFSISYPHVARSIYDRITIAMSNIFHLRAVPALPLTTSSIDGGQADRAERWSSRGPGTPQPENAVPETRSQATQTGSILARFIRWVDAEVGRACAVGRWSGLS